MAQRRADAVGAARTLATLAACAALGLYVALALLRAGHPFELEWMEGGALGHVERLRRGLPLYAAPSLDFTAFIYPPLYFEVGRLVGGGAATGFAPLRAVSIAASLASLCLIGWLVARESGDRRAGLFAAGLMAATYEASGAWFDLARVDSLFLALALAAVVVLRRGRSAVAGVVAGALAAAAFFTKQTALVLFAPFAACALIERDRRWLGFAVGFAVPLLAGCAALDAASDGWFRYYVFALPAQHALRLSKLASFWSADLLAVLPLALAAAVAFLVRARPRAGGDRSRFAFYACFAGGGLLAALLSRLHSGGYLNVLMPAHAAVAVLAGLGLATLLQRAAGRPRRQLALYALFVVQVAWLVADPRPRVPTAADRRAGEALLATLRSFDGDVLVLYHGYLPGRVGKPTSAQFMALHDVLRGEDAALRARLEDEIRRALSGGRYDAVVVDDERFDDALRAGYRDAGPLFDADVFYPVSGLRTRPERLWVARDGAAVPLTRN